MIVNKFISASYNNTYKKINYTNDDLDIFTIVVDNNLNISSNFSYNILDLNYIKNSLSLLKDDTKYIIANIYEKNYFITKQKCKINDFYNLRFEKFQIINAYSQKKFI